MQPFQTPFRPDDALFPPPRARRAGGGDRPRRRRRPRRDLERRGRAPPGLRRRGHRHGEREQPPDLGSEVVVRLPRAGAASAGPAGDPTPTDDVPRRVLVVDDNPDAADTLAELLSLWGHEVRSAANGPEALAMVVKHDPDLVLLDLGLPVMDGFEVARRLRGTRALLVAMTGYGQPEDVERTRAAGFAAHLVKPPDLDRIRALLRELSADEG